VRTGTAVAPAPAVTRCASWAAMSSTSIAKPPRMPQFAGRITAVQDPPDVRVQTAGVGRRGGIQTRVPAGVQGTVPLARYAPPSAPLRLPFTTIRTTWRSRGTEIELRIPDYQPVFDTKRYWDGDMTPASISRYAAWNSMATILKSIVVSNWTNATYASTCLGKLRWYQCSFCYIKYVQLMEI